MKYKSQSIPTITEGYKTKGENIVIPDQSMSLQEILTRFTRGETLSIGNEVTYHESQDDLEKISKLDLTEKEEFIEQQKETQRTYAKQEKRKAAETKKRLEDEVKQKIAADLAAQQSKNP